VKANLGHLEAASGISQLSKVVLQLRHKTLVQSINAVPLNPAIDLKNGAFYLLQEAESWPQLEDPASGALTPRRCMVNSFGAGGTYTNFILEEFPTTPSGPDDGSRGPQVCVFSANSESSLFRYLEKFSCFLAANEALSLVDLASSLRKVNNNLRYRAAIMVRTSDELREKLMCLKGQECTVAAQGLFLQSHSVLENHQDRNSLQRVITEWVRGETDHPDWAQDDRGNGCLSLPKYAFDHSRTFDFAVEAIPLEPADAGRIDGFYRDIFERIAQGTLSKELAWDLIQAAER
jgi:hypothetical protein